jgi:hypothetical protein
MKIQEKLDELRREAEKNQVEAEKLEELAKLYPDLEEHIGRWNKSVMCSASVNGLVTDFDDRFNCGCCPDSPWEVWPYLDTPCGKVYSNPAEFQVGEKYEGSAATPCKDWQNSLRKAGISEKVIEGVSNRFDSFREELKNSLKKDLDYVDMRFDNPSEEPEPFI